MDNPSRSLMGEQEMMRDCLNTLKYLAFAYEQAVLECDTRDLRHTLRNMLNDKLELAAATFRFMDQRGWYPTTSAPSEDISQVYQSFQESLQLMQS